MADADLKWVATAIMAGFLRRQQANPDRSAQWVDAVTDVLSAAAERPATSKEDQIISLLQGLTSMSETQASSNAALTAAVASLSTDMTQFSADLTAGLAALKSQIAAGGTPDFTAVDAATAAINQVDASLKTASDGLKAALLPATGATGATGSGPTGATGSTGGATGATGGSTGATGAAVVFDSADVTPNSAGGRNSSHLPGFDATLPETA